MYRHQTCLKKLKKSQNSLKILSCMKNYYIKTWWQLKLKSIYGYGFLSYTKKTKSIFVKNLLRV